jgi:hypothetical protein
MDDILRRFWDNLIGRASGPLNFRLMIQPTVASVLAIRAGIKDAREGRPAFLWAAITNPAYRAELVRHSWHDVGKVFVLAVVLDAVYQSIIQGGVFLGELLVVATVLAIVPYILIRGPVNRIAAALRQRTDLGERPEIVLDERNQFGGEQDDQG